MFSWIQGVFGFPGPPKARIAWNCKGKRDGTKEKEVREHISSCEFLKR